MANPHKGEVEFKAGGESYVLSLSANAMVEIEEHLGRSIEETMEMLKNSKLKLADLRVMFWQGLRDREPDTTLDDAKAILSKLKPVELGRLVGEALICALPDAEEGPAGGAANPPEPGGPKDGTGPAS